jgi:hypothetical protein
MPPQLLLRREAHGAGQVAEEGQDVEMALVVRGVDERAASGDVLPPRDRDADAEHPLERACARLREPPGHALVSGEPMDADRDGTHAHEHALEQVWRERDAQRSWLDRLVRRICRHRARISHGGAM